MKIHRETERDSETNRESETKTDRQRQRFRETERKRDRERNRETERLRDRQQWLEILTKTEKDRQIEKQPNNERDRQDTDRTRIFKEWGTLKNRWSETIKERRKKNFGLERRKIKRSRIILFSLAYPLPMGK